MTLVPLAPLTNIALLLRTHPEVAAGLREIVFMGGAAHVGNATASAEFNVFHDPEAAAVVLDAASELGIPVTMYGLDVFYEPRVSAEQAASLVHHGGRGAAELGGRLIGYQCQRFSSTAATIGDAGAVCAVIDRSGSPPSGCRCGSSWPGHGPAAARSSTGATGRATGARPTRDRACGRRGVPRRRRDAVRRAWVDTWRLPASPPQPCGRTAARDGARGRARVAQRGPVTEVDRHPGPARRCSRSDRWAGWPAARAPTRPWQPRPRGHG